MGFIVSGDVAINPSSIKSLRIIEDTDGVMLKIVASISGGDVVLKKANQYEDSNARRYIRAWYNLYVNTINGKRSTP